MRGWPPRRPRVWGTSIAVLLASFSIAIGEPVSLDATGAPTVPVGAHPQSQRMRARQMGVVTGTLAPGPLNAITDVGDVRVGHATLRDGDRFRTGVTAILPHGGNMFRAKVPAAIVVGNGFGKLAGLSQVQELGTLETPILLTGTLNVPRVADALISHMLGLPGNEDVRSINPVVGETNDGYLSDIRARPLGLDHVAAAIETAAAGSVSEGAVGAGTGTVAFGFKGGIGTSSRQIPELSGGWRVGVLVQTNFGGRRALHVAGVPVGAELISSSGAEETGGTAGDVMGNEAGGRTGGETGSRTDNAAPASPPTFESGDGSCMIVVATDAPLEHRALERLALRALMGMARTGSNFSNGSGDYVIAFSTHAALRSGPEADRDVLARTLQTSAMSPLFQAVIEATEEAIYNSLFMAETVTGFNGSRAEALPLDRVREILQRHGAIR